MSLLRSIIDFFTKPKIEYWHRDRSIEIVAKEQGIDIDELKQRYRDMISKKGRVESVSALRKQFCVPLSSAWRFINQLDQSV